MANPLQRAWILLQNWQRSPSSRETINGNSVIHLALVCGELKCDIVDQWAVFLGERGFRLYIPPRPNDGNHQEAEDSSLGSGVWGKSGHSSKVTPRNLGRVRERPIPKESLRLPEGYSLLRGTIPLQDLGRPRRRSPTTRPPDSALVSHP
jgi:hypothetical protein